MCEIKRTSKVAMVEVYFETLVKELGAKTAMEFISEIKECYGIQSPN